MKGLNFIVGNFGKISKWIAIVVIVLKGVQSIADEITANVNLGNDGKLSE